MIARTGHLGQDRTWQQEQAAGTGELEKEGWDRTAREDSRDRTTVARLPWQERNYRKARTWQQDTDDSHGRTAATGHQEHDIKDKTARQKGHSWSGSVLHECEMCEGPNNKNFLCYCITFSFYPWVCGWRGFQLWNPLKPYRIIKILLFIKTGYLLIWQ